MKRIMIMMMAATCLGVMAMAQDEVEEPVEKVKKEKKVKAPKVKKEKKPKAPKAPKAPKDAKEKKAKPAKPVAEEMTISGVITKEEVKKGDKVSVKYVLTDTEGNKITLPKPKKSKDGELIKLEDYADVAVKVTGTGTKSKKKDKEVIVLKTLTKVEKPDGVAEIEVFPKDDEVEDGEGAVE